MGVFTTVIVRISKTNTKSLTVGKKSARNLIYLVSSWIFCESKTDVSFGFEADLVVALGLKEEINLLAPKFPPRCPPFCLLWFSREHNARVHLTFPLNEIYGYSWLCNRLRSSAIIWKQLSAIVCDRLRSYGNQPVSILSQLETISLKTWERTLSRRAKSSVPASVRDLKMS